MSSENKIFGILGAIAVGAIAGVLLAPDKGEKTREKIALKAKKAKEDLTASVDTKMVEVSDKLETLKKAGNEILDKGKVELSKIKDELAS